MYFRALPPRSIQFAEEAEGGSGGEVDVANLDTAIACFTKADDAGLTGRAQAHRRSLFLRRAVGGYGGKMSPEDEESAVGVLAGLVQAGAFGEAQSLCGVLEPRSEDPEAFHTDVTRPITVGADGAR